jgi:hypothetical protein
MPNTSATGGYLTQTESSIDGLPFRRFIGTMLVGVSGLAATMVRPSWQRNPPPVPDIEVSWMAYGITAQRADDAPYMEDDASGSSAELVRHEEVDILVTGYGADCLSVLGSTRDALYLSQNRELMYGVGMGLVGCGDITHAPELVNEQYIDRCDMTVTIRREVRREYAVLNFVGVSGEILANKDITTLTRDWSA